MAGRRSQKTFDDARYASLQRIDVRERYESQCAFEKAIYGLPRGSVVFERERIVEWETPGKAWVRCSRPMIHAAHIWRRWKCGVHETDDGFPLKFHPLVAVAGCLDCHSRFDSRQFFHEYRIPATDVAKARALVEHTLAAARARGEFVAFVNLDFF